MGGRIGPTTGDARRRRPRPAPGSPSLGVMLERRLVIVTGKGGVGKSALAAGLAIAARRRGKKVLALSMIGPGDGLAVHLGVGRLSPTAAEIRPGLWALRIERARALSEYLQSQMRLPAVATFGPVARAFDALAAAAPAIREIVTIGKVLWEVRRDEWDLVIADGPPTGQIASYLRAAKTIEELVPAGRIAEQAGWMDATLRDADHTALALVTIPEELPTVEAEELLDWLGREQVVGHHEIVANRVLPPLDVATPLPVGPAGEAARLHMSLWKGQQEWLSRLPTAAELPFLFGLVTPTEVAAQLADVWEVE